MARERNTEVCGYCGRQEKTNNKVPLTIDWRLLSDSLGSCSRFSKSSETPGARYRGEAAKICRPANQKANEGEAVTLEHPDKLCQSIFATVCNVAFPKKSFLYNVVSTCSRMQ